MISTLPPPRSKHKRGARIDQHRGANRGEDEARFFEAVDHVGRDPGLGFDPVEHRVTVAGTPERTRRAGEDLGRTGGFGEHPESTHGAHRSVGGLRRDEAFAAHDIAEPEHLLLADQWLEGAVGAYFSDDEVE